jgi:hypothetical protein
VVLACSGEPEQPASVMIAITSEAPVPESIDTIEVSVERNGVERFYNIYTRDNSSAGFLPGTLAIDRPSSDDSDAPINVVVRARRGAEERAVRRATFSFVDQEQRLLRMPLRLSCMTDEMLSCPSGETCRSGVCEPDDVDLALAPAYSPGFVFPEQALSCYDPRACGGERVFIPGDVLRSALAEDCTLAAVFPNDQPRTDVNMEFVWRDDPRNTAGRELLTGMTVDYDPAEGWEFAEQGAGRVQLVPGVCAAIRDGRVLGTFEVFGCEPKDPLLPRCTDAVLEAAPSAP